MSKFNLEDVLMQVIESSEDESENCVELLDTRSVEEVVRELTSVNKSTNSADNFSNESSSVNNDDGDPDFELSDSNTDTEEIVVDERPECQSEDQNQIEPNLTTNDTPSKTNDHPDTVVEVPRGRKRTRNEELWQRNIRKRKRQVGDEYISQKGVRISKKGEYYKLGDSTRQKDFICALTLEVDIARRRKRKESSSKNRDKNYQYFLPVTDTENVRVCKLFFTKTLSISHSTVTNALNSKGVTGTYIGTDKRINKAAPNRIPENSITVIKDHMNSFPRIEPHYCRKDTTCQYLSPELNISKMYRLYLDFYKDREVEPVKESMYRHIFVTQFNLKCFVPKKDQCSICNQYYAADDDGKIILSSVLE
ncbi:hypothetical protein LOTGIDRAFT_176551 [Lottia gigantea]|uniref:Uncharacterized protein n=1 Tax=Lottia gigantea TaxID=225164 RepID=V4ASL8_LOTGI|nr:hypothetical protein LOTGIDRAFT_176551 [Lottia gigantea]ESO96736.1 hypothetical protein LOTGIDRAFT_176551 [Lottia gigantea]